MNEELKKQFDGKLNEILKLAKVKKNVIEDKDIRTIFSEFSLT
jgi:hypothetical protein